MFLWLYIWMCCHSFCRVHKTWRCNFVFLSSLHFRYEDGNPNVQLTLTLDTWLSQVGWGCYRRKKTHRRKEVPTSKDSRISFRWNERMKQCVLHVINDSIFFLNKCYFPPPSLSHFSPCLLSLLSPFSPLFSLCSFSRLSVLLSISPSLFHFFTSFSLLLSISHTHTHSLSFSFSRCVYVPLVTCIH